MLRATVLSFFLVGVSASLALPQLVAAQPAKLSAAQIVEKNVAARGGLDKWRAVQSLSWAGKMEAGGGPNPRVKGLTGLTPQAKEMLSTGLTEQVQLPFRWDMARGRKSHLEIDFNGQTAVQVFDGSRGWKVRPFLNREDAEPYTADELKALQTQSDLDGALIDYAAKGTKIEVVGTEQVEGRDAYKLKLTFKNNAVVHEWIDAESFLEVKHEGTPRRLDGRMHAVEVYLREYSPVQGLMIPHLIETKTEGVDRTEKIKIEKVIVNPRLDPARFTKPT
jgi:hypothetical protein